jgi:sugar phosphate isomerase/epimerase
MLKGLGAAIGGGYATLDTTAAAFRKADWKVAIGLNGFESAGPKYGKQFPIRDVLKFASEAGFDGVELVKNWPQPYPASTDTHSIQDLRSLYEEFGLQVFSIQTSARDAFAPDASTRQRWMKQMRDRIALAKALGCDCVGMWPSGRLRGQTMDQAIKHFAGSLRELAKIADDHGIIAAFEIEPPFVFNSEAILNEILQRADDHRVKTIYDPSHFDLMSGSKGKPHEMLARIGVHQIGYVHFTDTDGTLRDGGTSKHLPAGEGHVDINASFQTLQQGGFNGWIMIDGYQVPDPYAAGTKGIAAIKQFCAAAGG